MINQFLIFNLEFINIIQSNEEVVAIVNGFTKHHRCVGALLAQTTQQQGHAGIWRVHIQLEIAGQYLSLSKQLTPGEAVLQAKVETD